VNEEKIIILQIEAPEGLEAVEEIAAVRGYDMLLLGPGDFSHRIGKLGQIDDPEIHAALARVEKAARAHGRKCFSVAAPGTAKELFERGYAVTQVTADVIALGQSFRKAIADLNGKTTTEIDSVYR